MTKEESKKASRPVAQPFELTGGALCLDLANTVDARPTDQRADHLRQYDDLVRWAAQSGAISPDEGASLRKRARAMPVRARKALARAVEVREAIFEIFSASARNEPPPEVLAVFSEVVPAALCRLRLRGTADGYEWCWDSEPELDRVLWPAIRSAADLLTSPDLRLVRVCAADACDWLFLDRSRNRSRRWCDMKVCGNRHKARQHYRRWRQTG